MRDRHEGQRRALIEEIRRHGVDQLDILRAFDEVPRHEFVPEAVRHRAYEDAPLPIGFGQTASQPSLQAHSIQLLEVGPEAKVLEVGTGTGFQTAVLSKLVHRVYSIERRPELSQRARKVLDRLGISNVALLVGDGTVGWSRYAPYDGILVAAAAPEPPPALVDQLVEGGHMVIPLGPRNLQRLVVIEKTADGVRSREVLECAFVPLLGRFAWRDEEGGA